MTTCTFAGHREVYQPMINATIEKVIRELLQTDSEFIFYTGGMGEFDGKCASAVRSAKRQYSHLKIHLALVLPYMSNKLNTEKAYYEYYYDEIIIPEELYGVHYKAAIQKRNRWMVDRADCLIAYLFRDFGGAYEPSNTRKSKASRSLILQSRNEIAHLILPCPMGIVKKTGVKTMSDTYFDLPSRLEDSFPEIDSDIVTDLRKTSEEYADIQQQISDLKKRFPCIMEMMEDKGEIHLSAEEHAAFVQCLRLSRKLDDMERLQLYFRGHTDAVAYLKKIKAI